MERLIRQEPCGGCPFAEIRLAKMGEFKDAVRHLIYCTDELFDGKPILSDIEEDMVRGLIAQQSAVKTGEAALDLVRLTGSIVESGDDDHDFLMRVVCWIGIQRQQEEIDILELEINGLSCGSGCLEQL